MSECQISTIKESNYKWENSYIVEVRLVLPENGSTSAATCRGSTIASQAAVEYTLYKLVRS